MQYLVLIRWFRTWTILTILLTPLYIVVEIMLFVLRLSFLVCLILLTHLHLPLR